MVGDGDQQSDGLGLPAETLPLACGAAGSHQRGAGRRPPDRVSRTTKRVIFVGPHPVDRVSRTTKPTIFVGPHPLDRVSRTTK